VKRAIFLDRDGVINKLIYHPEAKEYGAPFRARDLSFYPWSLPALEKLKKMGFLLFLVSNQPDYAKGYTSLKNLKAVHQRFHKYLKDNGTKFTKYYYCYHHPDGKAPRYSRACPCRKPRPFFLLKAKKNYALDLSNSWFIGDSDSDIFCGQVVKTKTILIREKYSKQKRGLSRPDFSVRNLKEAVGAIINFKP